MKNQEYINLLFQVNTLNKHYKEINELTGENFSIFRILKLESSEVRLHSAFLGALLDPNGSHGQKDAFLKLFIRTFCYKQNSIDTPSCIVEIEKHTGFINDEGTEGGRIDITITDRSGNRINIENKIYAGDQKNQLLRYHNSAPSADLIYLTLAGGDPSSYSYGELLMDEHFKCYSYKTDILQWLELCRKEAVMFPVVRESITQYITLIKYLTNQTPNQIMEKELQQVLSDNLEAVFTITDNFHNTLKVIFEEYFLKIKSMCIELNLDCHHNVDFEKNWTGIWIYSPTWRNVYIGFQFQRYNKQMIYGVVRRPDRGALPQELHDKLNSMKNNTAKPNEWWSWSNKMEEPYDNWSKYDAWNAVMNGTMEKIMKDKIEYLLAITAGMERL